MTDSSNITRNLILCLALLTQGAVTSLAQHDTQKALPRCSNANLSGGYGFMVNGTTTNAEAYSLVGRFFADGKGGLRGGGVQAVNGSISRPAFTGTYSVNANCTGSANLMFDFGSAPLEFIIVDDGKTVDIIVAGPNGKPGQNEVGTATRQFNRP